MQRLSELLLHHGRTRPDLPFVAGHTHGDLLVASGRCANALASFDLHPGDRVAVGAETTVDTVITYLACLRAGLVFVPINPTSTAAETAAVLEAATPALHIGRVASAQVRHATADDVRARTHQSRVSFVDARSGPDGSVAMLFTSGTTGLPKGVPLSNINLVSNAEALIEAWQVTERDVLLHVLPLFHTHGLFVALNCVLGAGASMVLQEAFSPRVAVEALSDCTVFMGVPTHYTRLLTEPQLTPERTAGVRLFVSGSAPLSTETHAAFRERTGQVILERYGMTETSILCTNPLTGARRPGTVGRPLPGVDVRLSATGDIEVRGPNVFGGYWQQPKEPASIFTADGWFRTGDIGGFDEDGYLTILGRSKELIISGGFNVYPREVEEVVGAHEDVLESAVVGLPDADLGERVVAVVVLRDGTTVTPETIRIWTRNRLTAYKAPRSVVVLPALPRNALGKVEKTRLREELLGTAS